MMKYNLEERKELARRMRREGLTCSQCVALAFHDLTPSYDPATIERCAIGFASGISGSGETCGAISGAVMAMGMTLNLPKPELFARVRSLMERFRQANGSCLCRELKGPDRRPCIELIADATGLLHELLEKESADQ